MRSARAKTDDGIVFGEYTDDGRLITDGAEYAIEDESTLVAPCEPTALYCTGLNYQNILEARDAEKPENPSFFIKPPVSVCSTGESISYPSFTDELAYAGELAAVVHEECENVAPPDVPDVLYGYTIMNDLDAFDQPNLTARKAFNKSAPLGPWIETDIDPTTIDTRVAQNGEVKYEVNTELMLFEPQEIISYISDRVTLQSGDVISFGSPGGPHQVAAGDEISIQYDGIGELINTID